MKFFESKEFKRIQLEWQKNLKKDGFIDIELSKSIRIGAKRINLTEMELTREFFLTLDSLLTHSPDLPAFDENVLLAYSSGKSIGEIIKYLKTNRKAVERIIHRYSSIIIGIINIKYN